MSDIRRRRYDIVLRAQKERDVLLKEHNEKYHKEYAKLRSDCAKIGHVFGRSWDNGLGWQWKICANCGGSYDKECYRETP